jgi:succinyl-CoA synthetase alpha subunit
VSLRVSGEVTAIGLGGDRLEGSKYRFSVCRSGEDESTSV